MNTNTQTPVSRYASLLMYFFAVCILASAAFFVSNRAEAADGFCFPYSTTDCASGSGTLCLFGVGGDGGGAPGGGDFTLTCDPPVCTPSSACAASTCSGSTCSDSCGNSYAGALNCAPPPVTCTDLGYYHGTYPACYSLCSDVGEVGTWPFCVTPPPTTCTNGSPGPYPSCPLAAPPTCADFGQIGTYPACVDPAPPPTCTNGSPGPYPSCPLAAPPGCSNPTITAFTATPIRISSPGSTQLAVDSSGITTSCIVTDDTGATISTIPANASCDADNLNIIRTGITRQTTYTATCDGTITKKVIVNVNPRFVPF